VADDLSRRLLEYLLPEEPFHISQLSRPSPDAKRDFFNLVESGIAYVFDAFKVTENWSQLAENRRQREKNGQDQRNALIKNATIMFQVLPYEDLIPFFLDYKSKGPDYAYKKWIETIPTQRIRVRKKSE
jgi:hypothetical protein